MRCNEAPEVNYARAWGVDGQLVFGIPADRDGARVDVGGQSWYFGLRYPLDRNPVWR